MSNVASQECRTRCLPDRRERPMPARPDRRQPETRRGGASAPPLEPDHRDESPSGVGSSRSLALGPAQTANLGTDLAPAESRTRTDRRLRLPIRAHRPTTVPAKPGLSSRRWLVPIPSSCRQVRPRKQPGTSALPVHRGLVLSLTGGGLLSDRLSALRRR
jgi:hypothetical protein